MESGKILLTLGFALLGGTVGHFLKIPAGVMIGSMAGVAVANIGGIPLEKFPNWTFFILQVILGASLGIQINRSTVMEIKSAWAPSLLIAVMTIVFAIGVGWMIGKVTGWNGMTSFFAAAPGGATDMVLLAHGTDADIPKVLALHMVRLATVILSIPIILKFFAR
ncbi:AbrB family transcriptional regulator [Hazenella coriacea]|uniref:Membrane AbrB-like protein n=1 Tax=Hazenella coriacea TaxID=1179467 RepID=A0A4R3L545_9BACL|nr:AbrB family transcriptional regulator [Hazenella coriacea]TCS93264.1 membrane AbrB-like protein [Hazenella coriacea]